MSDVNNPSNEEDNNKLPAETLEDTHNTDNAHNEAADAPQFAALNDDKKEDRESIFDKKDEEEDEDEDEEEG